MAQEGAEEAARAGAAEAGGGGGSTHGVGGSTHGVGGSTHEVGVLVGGCNLGSTLAVNGVLESTPCSTQLAGAEVGEVEGAALALVGTLCSTEECDGTDAGDGDDGGTEERGEAARDHEHGQEGEGEGRPLRAQEAPAPPRSRG